jgi:hypothetical protein
MRLARGFKSSPALVVACVALLVSLTGTGTRAARDRVRIIVRDLSTSQPVDSYVYVWFED